MAGLASTQANSRDIIKAPVALLEFGPWVTNAGAATFLQGGWLRDVKLNIERTLKEVEADNASYPLDAYYTSTKVRLTGAFLESNLSRIGIALGLGDADTVYATPGPPVTLTLPLDEPPAINNYWQVRLTLLDQSLYPKRLATWTDVSDDLIKRTVTLWRCMFQAKLDMTVKKADEVMHPFEVVAFLDTTITPSTTNGRIGKIVDSST